MSIFTPLLRAMQGSDLRRLLEMYERWQRNLFPSLSFDQFIAGVEGIGRTAEVKVRCLLGRQEYGVRQPQLSSCERSCIWLGPVYP
jgi:hypothetical protein